MIASQFRRWKAWVRQKRSRPAKLIALLAILIVLLLIRFNVIRLGPSAFDVTRDQFRPTFVAYHEEDLDPSNDYYSLTINIPGGNTKDPVIKPWSLDVSVRLVGAEAGGWVPQTGDYARTEQITISRTWTYGCDTSAGRVTTRHASGFFNWSVRGDRGLWGQPIYTDYIVFCLSPLRVPQNATFTPEVTVTLSWYYANGLQAYPVATRTAVAEGFSYPS